MWTFQHALLSGLIASTKNAFEEQFIHTNMLKPSDRTMEPCTTKRQTHQVSYPTMFFFPTPLSLFLWEQMCLFSKVFVRLGWETVKTEILENEFKLESWLFSWESHTELSVLVLKSKYSDVQEIPSLCPHDEGMQSSTSTVHGDNNIRLRKSEGAGISMADEQSQSTRKRPHHPGTLHLEFTCRN